MTLNLSMRKDLSSLCIIILITLLHRSRPIPFCSSRLVMVVMSRAIIDACLFFSLEYMHLYNPRCCPDGEVVVLSRHILKRFLRSSWVMDCFCS